MMKKSTIFSLWLALIALSLNGCSEEAKQAQQENGAKVQTAAKPANAAKPTEAQAVSAEAKPADAAKPAEVQTPPEAKPAEGEKKEGGGEPQATSSGGEPDCN